MQYFLNELGLEHDTADFSGRTPFSIGIDFQISKRKQQLEPAVNLLIQKGVNIDQANEANETPYLRLYNERLSDIAEFLRQKGANINQVSKSGIFALKIALMRRDNDEIKRLNSHGADINLKDHH